MKPCHITNFFVSRFQTTTREGSISAKVGPPMAGNVHAIPMYILPANRQGLAFSRVQLANPYSNQIAKAIDSQCNSRTIYMGKKEMEDSWASLSFFTFYDLLLSTCVKKLMSEIIYNMICYSRR